MHIEVTCRACGQPYTPSAEDVRRGPSVYHRCPDCRSRDTVDPQEGAS